MIDGPVVYLFAAFGLSLVFTALYRVVAQKYSVLDVPNERSSHKVPVPRGGGLAFVLASLLVYAFLRPEQVGPIDALFLCALLIALCALLDDFGHFPTSVRFLAYGGCIAAFLWLTVSAHQATSLAPFPPLANYLMMFVALLWHTNLFNFMDGIDGLATSQALFVLLAASLLAAGSSGMALEAWPMLLVAASLSGFLIFNWAPASLFMGDVGSVFLGFLLAGFAVVSVVSGQLGLMVWLILLAVFITDASYTLIWRIATGQPFLHAHRLHLYQRLALHWKSHATTVGVLMGVNVVWLLPLAWSAHTWPDYAFWIFILGYTPLLFAMVKLRRLT